jgi:nitrite reductase/ring-hydroxylating ferredoxin subunit
MAAINVATHRISFVKIFFEKVEESMSGNELFVAEASELKDGERKVVPFGQTEIGVYRMKGKLYAYQNLCAHQGGPACEGLTMPKVEAVIAADKTYQGSRFNYEEWHIVCPWHGWEYDLMTGEFVVNRKFRLKKYPVVERDGKVYVLAE